MRNNNPCRAPGEDAALGIGDVVHESHKTDLSKSLNCSFVMPNFPELAGIYKYQPPDADDVTADL